MRTHKLTEEDLVYLLSELDTKRNTIRGSVIYPRRHLTFYDSPTSNVVVAAIKLKWKRFGSQRSLQKATILYSSRGIVDDSRGILLPNDRYKSKIKASVAEGKYPGSTATTDWALELIEKWYYEYKTSYVPLKPAPGEKKQRKVFSFFTL